MAAQDMVAFITGGNKGIGLETARGLGQLGISVIIGSRDETNGWAAADKLRSRASRGSSPFGSTSQNRRIIRRLHAILRGVMASWTSWSIMRVCCWIRSTLRRAGQTRPPR